LFDDELRDCVTLLHSVFVVDHQVESADSKLHLFVREDTPVSGSCHTGMRGPLPHPDESGRLVQRQKPPACRGLCAAKNKTPGR
jgi:hypothetical protein